MMVPNAALVNTKMIEFRASIVVIKENPPTSSHETSTSHVTAFNSLEITKSLQDGIVLNILDVVAACLCVTGEPLVLAARVQQ